MLMAPPKTRHDVRVFSIRSFMEVLMKVGLNYLNFHGTDHQARLPSGTKAIWIIEYIAAKFEQLVETKRPALVARFPAKQGNANRSREDRMKERRFSCLPSPPLEALLESPELAEKEAQPKEPPPPDFQQL